MPYSFCEPIEPLESTFVWSDFYTCVQAVLEAKRCIEEASAGEDAQMRQARAHAFLQEMSQMMINASPDLYSD